MLIPPPDSPKHGVQVQVPGSPRGWRMPSPARDIASDGCSESRTPRLLLQDTWKRYLPTLPNLGTYIGTYTA